MSDFNPWRATWPEAWAAYVAAGRPRTSDNPVAQWGAARQIDHFWKQGVLAGDGHAVMAAVTRCAHQRLLMPDWLAEAFVARAEPVLNAAVGSWDEAFGLPYPKRARLHTIRLRRQKAIALALFFASPDAPPRGPAGWKLAAQACGITAKQAKAWTPKGRNNTRGHKPYRKPRPALGAGAHDPFGLAAAQRSPEPDLAGPL